MLRRRHLLASSAAGLAPWGAAEAATLAKQLDVGFARPFKSIAEMVADPEVDAIWLCGPNHARVENVEEIVDTIARGRGTLKGIACEKPLARNVAEVRRHIAAPLILENITCTVTLPGAEMTEAQFVSEAIRATGCGLLLDVTNLFTNCANRGRDPLDALDALPLDRVVQLHFVGGHTSGGDAGGAEEPRFRAAGGTLYVVATPIGNLRDITARALDVLANADVVAAEDTRRVRRLAADLDVSLAGRVVSFYDAVEGERVPGLLEAAEQGQQVLVVSDAGMPAVSDPGAHLVALAIDADLAVEVIPGPSAVLAALVQVPHPAHHVGVHAHARHDAVEPQAHLVEEPGAEVRAEDTLHRGPRRRGRGRLSRPRH